MIIANSACIASRLLLPTNSVTSEDCLRVDKKLGGDRADAHWSKGYSISYNFMLTNTNWDKARKGCVVCLQKQLSLRDQLGIDMLVGGRCSVGLFAWFGICGFWWVLGFLFVCFCWFGVGWLFFFFPPLLINLPFSWTMSFLTSAHPSLPTSRWGWWWMSSSAGVYSCWRKSTRHMTLFLFSLQSTRILISVVCACFYKCTETVTSWNSF